MWAVGPLWKRPERALCRFTPDPGLRGHCIPIDPFYLTWKVRQYGKHTRFIELAGEINHAMPDYVVQRSMEARLVEEQFDWRLLGYEIDLDHRRSCTHPKKWNLFARVCGSNRFCCWGSAGTNYGGSRHMASFTRSSRRKCPDA